MNLQAVLCCGWIYPLTGCTESTCGKKTSSCTYAIHGMAPSCPRSARMRYSRLQLPCAARDAWYTLTEMHPVQWMTVTCSLIPRPCLAFCRLPYCKRGPAQLFIACHTASDGKLGGAWERGYVTFRPAFYSGRCGPLIVHVHTCNVHAQLNIHIHVHKHAQHIHSALCVESLVRTKVPP